MALGDDNVGRALVGMGMQVPQYMPEPAVAGTGSWKVTKLSDLIEASTGKPLEAMTVSWPYKSIDIVDFFSSSIY